MTDNLHATIDFETRSRIDLRRVGAYRYAADPSTEPLCMAFAVESNPNYKSPIPNVDLWRGPAAVAAGLPFIEPPVRLFEAIRQGCVVEAHNAGFERAIWRRVMVPRFGWPDIPDQQWRCTAARAAAAALPRSLGDVARILQLTEQKDNEGHKLMMELCKPLGKNRKGSGEFLNDPVKFRRQEEYCLQDVRTEIAVSRRLPPLHPAEWQVWLVDQAINERGMAVDLMLADHMIDLIERHRETLLDRLRDITNDEVPKPTARRQLMEWMTKRDMPINNTQAVTLRRIMADNPGSDEAVVAWICLELNKASVAKYRSIIERADKDGRIRDLLMYHGAQTGRWCLTGDHEVLSPSGWVRLDQWSGGDIMQSDGNFRPATSNVFDYEGEMISVENTRFQQLSTPDHTMLPGVTVSQLTSRHKINRTVQSPISPFYDDLTVRILVMTQADGHYHEDGLRFSFKKRRKVHRARWLLGQAGIKFSERHYKDGRAVFNVYNHSLPAWLKAFSDKTFPWQMLGCGSAFVDELVHWDGSKSASNSVQYSTTNKQNSDFVQAWAHTHGMSCNVLMKRRPDKENWNTIYVCNIWLSPSPSIIRQSDKETTTFRGKVYCPTTKTGFFLVRRNGVSWITGNSGKGVQPQNIVRGSIDDMEATVAKVLGQEYSHINAEVTDPMELFSSLIRGALIAPEGKELAAADYSAIEARGTIWLARAHAALGVFHRGEDIYLDMASDLYRKSFTKKDKKERQVGKAIILGCGYGMGPPKFYVTAQNGGVKFTPEMCEELITDPEDLERYMEKIAKDEFKFLLQPGLDLSERSRMQMCVAIHAVTAYRRKYPEIPRLWKNTEIAAIRAMEAAGSKSWTPVEGTDNLIHYKVIGQYLRCQLPSGRQLSYPFAKVSQQVFKWNPDDPDEKPKLRKVLRYMTDGPGGFRSDDKGNPNEVTYGGKLVENNVQALSRDLMADAMVRAEKRGKYLPVLTVHDELVTEVVKGAGSAAELEALMNEKPKWASDFPVASEAWIGHRYRK